MPEIKIKHNPVSLRQQSYPEVGNQLDAIMKGLGAYSKGEPLPQIHLHGSSNVILLNLSTQRSNYV